MTQSTPSCYADALQPSAKPLSPELEEGIVEHGTTTVQYKRISRDNCKPKYEFTKDYRDQYDNPLMRKHKREFTNAEDAVWYAKSFAALPEFEPVEDGELDLFGVAQ